MSHSFPTRRSSDLYNLYKNFTGVNLSKCVGTTPFDTAYAPLDLDLGHARNDERLINAFRTEIYNIKGHSCTISTPCPDYLVLNSTIANGVRTIAIAKKAIILNPNFKADGSQNVVFRTSIGCTQTASETATISNFIKTNSTSAGCGPFTWDVGRNTCQKVGINTRFNVFVTNLDIRTYAEFSIDGSNWNKASIGDNGWEVSVPWVSGGAQIFFARPADNSSGAIIGWLGHCN